jgi:glyoxylase-like metal-dependent hydrolase (beta-lactamase superfamily II)
MRVHHLNCGTMCPLGGALMYGVNRGPAAKLVCHCLLIETDRHGLVLVDTGLGSRDALRPRPRLSPFFMALLRMRLDPEETALRQVERLGFRARDVRHIVLTHLDFDHAGGIEDFPEATIHVYAAELDAALSRRSLLDRNRYRPLQWDQPLRWRRYATDDSAGEGWFGFRCVRDLQGLPPEILMVPLVGHTLGHCGIAVDTGVDGGGWMLHAGDAYFFREEMADPRPYCTPGLAGYQKLMEVDRRARLENQRRLRGLARTHRHEVRLFCAHDPVEFERQQAAAVEQVRSAAGD